MNGLADACPACFPGDAPAAVPASVHAEADGRVSAYYRCALCGATWRTLWKVTAAWPEIRDRRPVSALLDEVIGLLAHLLAGEEAEAA